MINFQNASFIKSIQNTIDAPKELSKEVLIVGKSNVGKSSLINAICNKKKLAFTSSKPGHTRLLNYFNIDNKFYLVDAPGYGYARGGIDLDSLFKEMMDDYFNHSKNLKLVLLLLDSRRELSDNDTQMISYFQDTNIPFFIVITKIDKVNQKQKAALIKYLNELNLDKSHLFMTSSFSLKGLDLLKADIEKKIIFD